jgi:glycosyltransferase involved in cell wall biosynthesis
VSTIGVVAIGRNEGERLRRCLDALAGLGTTIVYVDSGSTDGSLALARSRGVAVVELDMSTPFTAARARNAGFDRLSQIDPGVQFVQFLDGDCEVADGWLGRGRRALEGRPKVAVVFGRRNERYPERSIYNRLADFEWNAPDPPGTGDAEAPACGGDAMIRAEAFRAAGGYNPSVPAGEEPELCQRLRDAGWSVLRLDADMTWHDSAMLRFGQWSRRQFRSGYGSLDFSTRFGRLGDDLFRRQIRSVRLWALGWPLTLLVAGGLAGALGGPAAAALAVVPLASALPAQAARIAWRNRWRGGGPRAALAYGALTMVGKFYQMAGQLLYLRDRFAGRHARLIEYKFVGTRPGPGPAAPLGLVDPEGASAGRPSSSTIEVP